ncbi:MAG: hypothetical protein ABFD89_29420 [Bryobacteraceae bacterium]
MSETTTPAAAATTAEEMPEFTIAVSTNWERSEITLDFGELVRTVTFRPADLKVLAGNLFMAALRLESGVH